MRKQKKHVAPIIDLALKYDYKKRLCQIYVIEGSYYFWIKEDLSEALQNLKKAIEVSEEVGDFLSYSSCPCRIGTMSSDSIVNLIMH